MSIIKRLFSKNVVKLKRVFSAYSSEPVLIYPFVDIAVPSLDMAFVPLELSSELNELCNVKYNDHHAVR